MTNEEAVEAILAHHRQLVEDVTRRTSELHDAVTDRHSFEIERARLVSYLVDEVLPHAGAEEHSIYPAAADRLEMSSVVDAMVDEHRQLASDIERLARSTTGAEADRYARSIVQLFTSHVVTENEVLLPALVADEEVSIVQLLDQMHRLTEKTSDDLLLAVDVASLDHEAAVLSQLLHAATALAQLREGDQACALVATTWAALRVPRPDLAELANRSLHRLVRMASQEAVVLRPRDTVVDTSTTPLLDVRTLAPAQRHEIIFSSYEALDQGASFLLVNDHDPKPLRYQFEAEHAGAFTWDYVESGPKVWRVRIGRIATIGKEVSVPAHCA